MKRAIEMGGSEARAALERLEAHVLYLSIRDEEMAAAISKAEDGDSIVDILLSLNPPPVAVDVGSSVAGTPPAEVPEAGEVITAASDPVGDPAALEGEAAETALLTENQPS